MTPRQLTQFNTKLNPKPLPTYFLTILIIGLFASQSAMAQPTGNINRIEQQIQELQRQLQKAKSQQGDDNPFSERRVVNLGSQSSLPVQRPRVPQTQLQFYDLSDVFGLSPEYTVPANSELENGINGFAHSSQNTKGGGGFGGGGFGGAFSIPPGPLKPLTQYAEQDRGLTMDSIIGIIENTIDKNLWKTTDASIARIGNGLLINAVPSTHDKIARLFDLFRKQWGSLRTISLEAYWISMTPGEMKKLVHSRASQERQRTKGVGVVDSPSWETFFEQAEAADKIAYSSALTLQNGQTAFTVSGNQPRFLSHIEPFFSEIAEKVPAKLAHTMRYSQLQTGLTLQCTPMATRGGNFVLLDLHCRIVELQSSNGKEKPVVTQDQNSKPGPEVLARLIESPNYSVQRLATTVRCPKNEVVMAGGVTWAGPARSNKGGRQPADDSKNSSKSKEQLYLFVRTNIFNVTPDQSDRK